MGQAVGQRFVRNNVCPLSEIVHLHPNCSITEEEGKWWSALPRLYKPTTSRIVIAAYRRAFGYPGFDD
ncbi:hypothetical protein CEXT_187661 [Caerostris extrusa]|uniref:Uncharacterized protein n=1 Tax=Caerostris extrusa TaxID=172846 RepID=A0AAV4WY24_CAEEX|nr:hypothetical protein CEXT_187661 [Caerostris extrusa]